jgi:hypothetical protein
LLQKKIHSIMLPVEDAIINHLPTEQNSAVLTPRKSIGDQSALTYTRKDKSSATFLCSSGRLLGQLLVLSWCHGSQTPIFTAASTEETLTGSCPKASRYLGLSRLAEGRKRTARSN